jgi:hypothetical protein
MNKKASIFGFYSPLWLVIIILLVAAFVPHLPPVPKAPDMGMDVADMAAPTAR